MAKTWSKKVRFSYSLFGLIKAAPDSEATWRAVARAVGDESLSDSDPRAQSRAFKRLFADEKTREELVANILEAFVQGLGDRGRTEFERICRGELVPPKLLPEGKKWWGVVARKADSFRPGSLYAIGELLQVYLAHRIRIQNKPQSNVDSQPRATSNKRTEDLTTAGSSTIRCHVVISDLESIIPDTCSARQDDGKWRLEKVIEEVTETANQRLPLLHISPSSLERHLEDFLVKHWIDLNFGFPIHLLGRQIQIRPESKHKVDLIGRKDNGAWVAIELKKSKCDSLTQLRSYMKDLKKALHRPEERVEGILIAPGYGYHALNDAPDDPRISLYRYRVRKSRRNNT